MNSNTDQLMERFLLDKLSPEERAETEERLLADNDLFEAMLVAESTLADRYVRGELSGHDLEQAAKLFESSTTQRQERLFVQELSTTLKSKHNHDPLQSVERCSADSISPALIMSPSLFSPATYRWISVAACVLCLCCIALAVYFYRRQVESDQQRATQEQTAQQTLAKLEKATTTNEQLAQELDLERQQRLKAEELITKLQVPPSNEISILVLTPGSGNRGSSATASVTPRSKSLQFQLELDDESKSGRQFGVVIATLEGRKIWEGKLNVSQIRQGKLHFTLPVKLFSYDDYHLQLSVLSQETSITSDYFFRVRK